MDGGMNRRDAMKTIGIGAAALTIGGAATGQTTPIEGGGPVTYELPKLPYAFDALAPAIEDRVIRTHYEKHHAAYVKGLNATLDKLEKARAAGDVSNVKALSRDLAFHGSGHVLHSLYWASMKPGGASLPSCRLGVAIARDFGSFAAFSAQFAAAAKDVEGSGWAVLAWEPLGRRLLVLQAEKHQDLTIWGVTPLMVCDVWEHAYYAQYLNNRGGYVDAFMTLVDWKSAAHRFEKISGA
jgi:Fe-Mn family superoxide dismutase